MDITATGAGFVRVAACSLPVRLGEPAANAAAIRDLAIEAARRGAALALFPELSLTGYSLDDLFMQNVLLNAAEVALAELAAASRTIPCGVVLGAPLRVGARLYNCGIVIAGGRILGAVPKSYLPNYREFYEHRQFASGLGVRATVQVGGHQVTVSPRQLFEFTLPDAVPPTSQPLPPAQRPDEPPPGPANQPPGLPDELPGLSTELPGLPNESPGLPTELPGPATELPGPARFVLGVEVCEDLWVPLSPGAEAALAGAEVIANLSSSPITVAKSRERASLAGAQSAKLICGYVYAASGAGESSTDLSWDGQTLVFERGELLAEGPRFATGPVLTLTDLDLAVIRQDRLRQGTFDDNRVAHHARTAGFEVITASFPPPPSPTTVPVASPAGPVPVPAPATNPLPGAVASPAGPVPAPAPATNPSPGAVASPAGPVPVPAAPPPSPPAFGLVRAIPRFPFVPDDPARQDQDCYEAYNIQVSALMQRLAAIGEPKIVIGVSGGLDSSHALIVAAKAMDNLGRPRTDILAFTMPGFGTTGGTQQNATRLSQALGVTFEEIDIRPAANLMLEKIVHPFAHGQPVYDITFENIQAGLRTDYLFRLANQRGGIVLGTGDLSELALGWCTYGVGDQMSHYNANAGIPKTLIQFLIAWVVQSGQFDKAVGDTLTRILDTEISPELIPPAADGSIQSTQLTIGPYPLHDFMLYYTLRFGLSPKEIYFRLREAWADPARGDWPAGVKPGDRRGYTPADLLHWMEVFYRRFIAAQFKRSALPNGPKVVRGGSLSPRGDWRQPSDVAARIWLEQVEWLKATQL